MFDFLKRKSGNVPDVGKEDESKEKYNEDEDEDEEPEKRKGKKDKKKKFDSSGKSHFSDNRLRIEKLEARFEELRDLLKGFNERLGNMNQQIGEVRAMAINNEKSISKSTQEATRAIEIVSEVKPEKIRADYQKIDLRVTSAVEKLEENKNILDTLMSEIKDLRRKAGIFVGTDALLRLNEDVKKDLIELQKLGSKVKINADKSEEIFIEIRKNFSANQKLKENFDNLSNNLSETKKEIEKIKVGYNNLIKTQDFEQFSKKINDELRENNNKLNVPVEMSLEISKKNREDIDNISAKLKDSNVVDHEEELGSVVKLIDALAGKISDIEKKVGIISSGKISIGYDNKRIMKKHKRKFKNVRVHSKK